MPRKATKRKRPEQLIDKPDKEKPDRGREHITKYLQKLYTFVTRESDLYWGLKQQDAVINTKRVPCLKKKKVEKAETEYVPTVSEGYGEATLGSVSRLLHLLETLEDESLRLNSESTFLDIGSGFGKVVFHAKLFCNVKRSVGIEYVSSRHDVALKSLEHFRFNHILAEPSRKKAKTTPTTNDTNKENHSENAKLSLASNDSVDKEQQIDVELGERLGDHVEFECGDATKYAPFNYSHIYMYDCIFSEDTYAILLPQLDESPFKILVSFRSMNYLVKRGLKHIKQIGTMRVTSTGRQCFSAHVYAKTTEMAPLAKQMEEEEMEEEEGQTITSTSSSPVEGEQKVPEINTPESQASTSEDALMEDRQENKDAKVEDKQSEQKVETQQEELKQTKQKVEKEQEELKQSEKTELIQDTTGEKERQEEQEQTAKSEENTTTTNEEVKEINAEKLEERQQEKQEENKQEENKEEKQEENTQEESKEEKKEEILPSTTETLQTPIDEQHISNADPLLT